jgi:hypothetical protein
MYISSYGCIHNAKTYHHWFLPCVPQFCHIYFVPLDVVYAPQDLPSQEQAEAALPAKAELVEAALPVQHLQLSVA